MRFYIDFENTGCSGLAGIDKLKANDTVYIYYSNDPGLNMETVKSMIASAAKIEFVCLPPPIKNMNEKNALDILILNDILRQIPGMKKNESVFTVTNDTGFDAALNSLGSGKITTERIPSIQKAAEHKKDTAQKKATAAKQQKTDVQIDASVLSSPSLELSKTEKKEVVEIVCTAKSRSALNNVLQSKFGTKTASLMKVLKPHIKSLPGK